MIVTTRFYNEGKIAYFWIALSILILTHLAYIVAYIRLYYEYIETLIQLLILIVLLPISPLIPYIWFFHEFKKKHGLNGDTTQNHTTALIVSNNNDDHDQHTLQREPKTISWRNWTQKKLELNAGFLIESLLESFPQALLQCIAIVYYQNTNDILSIVSILLSLLSIMIKCVVFVNGFLLFNKLTKWLCFIIDVFAMFTIVSWAFYINDKDYAVDIDDNIYNEQLNFGYKILYLTAYLTNYQITLTWVGYLWIDKMIYLTLPFALFSAIMIVDRMMFYTSIPRYLRNTWNNIELNIFCVANGWLNIDIFTLCCHFVVLVLELIMAILLIVLLLSITLFFMLIIQEIGMFSIFFYFNLNQDIRFSCDMSTLKNDSIIWRDVVEWLFKCSSEYSIIWHVLSFNYKKDTIDIKKRLFCINFVVWKYHFYQSHFMKPWEIFPSLPKYFYFTVGDRYLQLPQNLTKIDEYSDSWVNWKDDNIDWEFNVDKLQDLPKKSQDLFNQLTQELDDRERLIQQSLTSISSDNHSKQQSYVTNFERLMKILQMSDFVKYNRYPDGNWNFVREVANDHLFEQTYYRAKQHVWSKNIFYIILSLTMFLQFISTIISLFFPFICLLSCLYPYSINDTNDRVFVAKQWFVFSFNNQNVKRNWNDIPLFQKLFTEIYIVLMILTICCFVISLKIDTFMANHFSGSDLSLKKTKKYLVPTCQKFYKFHNDLHLTVEILNKTFGNDIASIIAVYLPQNCEIDTIFRK